MHREVDLGLKIIMLMITHNSVICLRTVMVVHISGLMVLIIIMVIGVIKIAEIMIGIIIVILMVEMLICRLEFFQGF